MTHYRIVGVHRIDYDDVHSHITAVAIRTNSGVQGRTVMQIYTAMADRHSFYVVDQAGQA